jgi:hypothetical protein
MRYGMDWTTPQKSEAPVYRSPWRAGKSGPTDRVCSFAWRASERKRGASYCWMNETPEAWKAWLARQPGL